MQFSQEELQNNPALREIVKEVVKEQMQPELEKLKPNNQYLQEGNMFLNE